MRILFTLLLLLFSASIVYGQEKKIKKAIEALSENNYTEYNSLLNDYVKEAPEVPLAAYALSLGFTKPGSPSYDLEKGFKKLQSVKDWLSSNEADKGWCKSFDLCAENIQVQIDSIAITALRQVEQNKTDESYQKFIKSFTNTPINDKAILSYHHWKFELASSANTVESLESFIKQFPNAQDISLAKAKIERIEYIQTVKSDEISQFEAFLKKYPSSIHRSELQQKLIDLEFKQSIESNEVSKMEAFLKKYPNSSYTAEVKIKIEEIDFSNAKKASSKEPLEAFIRDYPNSKYIEEAKKKLDELVNGVVIVSTGQGKTEDEAKQSALRSAIEQTFGAFISSKTEILNDQIISDQITSLSTGNIRSFEIINSVELPTGGYSTTLKAIISIDKLTSFVQSKGVQVEFKGGLFAMNVKQQMLNEQAEINIVYEMISVLHEVMQTSFDFSISSTEPKSLDNENNNWEIPLKVRVSANKNIDFCGQYLVKSLSEISLSAQELENYKSLSKPIFPVELTYNGVKNSFYLRKHYSIEILGTILNNWDFYMSNFIFTSGVNSPVQFMELKNLGQDYLFIPWKRIENDYSGTLRILIPSPGQAVYDFSRADRKTLQEIEKITGYTVESKGAFSKIKNGGYVVYEENGHGLIVSIFNLGEFNLTDARKACDESTFGGFDDWRLPDIEELKLIYENLCIFDIRGFHSSLYLSNTSADDYPSLTFDFSEGKVFNPGNAGYSDGHRFPVLAVRKY